ncbi:hypothetical protein HHL19_35790 [Streptomyces sp. R302]|uniref:hypothetical protein n=1 Tax=unclassified Streptomyces TaxID=2593676 RepID=UPI00145CE7F9|nr:MULTISPECIES: hypothetical protein [unclassified Streptomyces]NML55097.1 hypothetical protein [Streptomyces sp. R301]NML83873.1 hypothetical protein [Streptomyces sp. R302]
MSTVPSPQGINWSTMRRADFDGSADDALVDAADVRRPVATQHANGTDALFGDAPRARRTRSAPQSAKASEPQQPLF